MKKIILTTALLMFAVSLAQAGPQHKGHEKYDKYAYLQLTDEQKVAFDDVKKEKKRKYKAVMAQLRAETNAQFAEFLTEEQMQAMAEKRAKYAEHKKHKKHKKHQD